MFYYWEVFELKISYKGEFQILIRDTRRLDNYWGNLNLGKLKDWQIKKEKFPNYIKKLKKRGLQLPKDTTWTEDKYSSKFESIN